MTQTWKCDVCGYVHTGPQPPDTCPICGVEKEMFAPFEAAVEQSRHTSKTTRWRCTVCDYIHEGESPPEICPVCGAKASLFEPVHEQAGVSFSPDVETVVIIGAGIAGVIAAEKARHTAFKVKIIVINKEPAPPYYRLNLTRFLAKEVDENSLPLHDRDWFKKNRIQLLQGEVTQIQRQDKCVKLRDGSEISYDRLILANGAHPFIPPLPGASREGVYVLRTVEDAKEIAQRAQTSSRCVCIGGGLLGLETAGALVRNGVKTTVLESFKSLLPRQLPERAGKMLEQHVSKNGIDVRCDVKVSEIIGDEAARAVRLGSGEEIGCDLVVLSTGVRPNSYLARQCQLDVSRGVIVDDELFTSDRSILAAGDLTEHRGVVYGIWPASYSQGTVAGINAVGGRARFPGIPPSNRLKVMDVDLFSIGQIEATDGSYSTYEHETETTYVRILCQDSTLKGAALYGDTTSALAIKEAIENQTQLGDLDQLGDNVPGWMDFLSRCGCNSQGKE